jgi:ATP-dependent DNA helicase UvrD/PcrA
VIFDADQLEVLGLKTGNHTVLAPPGSGKTELLSHRTSAAVAAGADPLRMVCLTFTNRAARAMTERMPAACRDVFVGNFHAFGIRFLMKGGYFPIGGTVLDEEDTGLFVRDACGQVLDKFSPSKREGLLSRWGLSSLIDLHKKYTRLKTQRRLGLPESVTRESEMMLGGLPDSARRIKAEDSSLFRVLEDGDRFYVRLKQSSMAIDFDDILSLTAHHLMAERAEDQAALMDWIQVDEGQDLNAIQWCILDLLRVNDSHLVVLGDVQQSIFSFMGGSLVQLARKTRGFTEHLLKTNYRSPAYLLRLYKHYANLVLNTPLQISAANQPPGFGGAMQLNVYDDSADERTETARTIVPWLLGEEDPEVAILTRTNEMALKFSAALTAAGRPHFLVTEFDIFRSRNAKDFMALLSVLHNPGDRVAWMRLVRIFGRLSTLKEARRLVNQLFGVAVNPADLLAEQNSIFNWPPGALAELARRGNLVIFDTETTGLDTETVDIVQIAALELVKGKPGRSFNVYVKTEQSLEETRAIHGITEEKLRLDGLDRRRALEDFVEFAGDATLVAHNLDFDWRVLNSNLEREGMSPLNRDEERYCTLSISRALYPDAPKHTLASLLEFLKLKGENTHDAFDDVRATANLLKRLGRDARRKRRKAMSAVSAHSKALTKFSRGMKPLMNKLDILRKRETSFEEVFSVFVDHLRSNYRGYKWEFEEEIRAKLIGHMNATTQEAPLEVLLNRHLRQYKQYREADLIMEEDKLVVSTVHRAKGLEFNTVIIPGAVEGNYPFHWAIKSGDPKKIAEEARIFYVALSRAKRRLIVSWHRRCSDYGRLTIRHRTRFLRGLGVHFSFREP